MQKGEGCLGYLADHIFPTPHFDRRRPPSAACSESTNLQKTIESYIWRPCDCDLGNYILDENYEWSKMRKWYTFLISGRFYRGKWSIWFKYDVSEVADLTTLGDTFRSAGLKRLMLNFPFLFENHVIRSMKHSLCQNLSPKRKASLSVWYLI